MERKLTARTIGITGNIGAGKSTVARMLEDRGCSRIDADLVARKLMEPGLPAYNATVHRFGPGILLPDARIDRAALAAIVFRDPQALLDLDRAIHPHTHAAILAEVSAFDRDAIAVIEAIKLIEAGWVPMLDSLWLVVTSPDVAIARVAQARNMEPEEVRRRLVSQPSVEPKRALADVVIENDGDLRAAADQVDSAFRRLQARWDTK
jgi:dephospho-CoA kinase